ncbi:hypothetical protein HDF16_000095 [Granulicella aggregans]|uniref:Uncharacterized protein n=1 Tax=Granulicella aggregans TaxID=474949 RepID=A0A7W8E1L6_9BACT|nr:hypothetical protein [Granulicella aggregans]
MAENQRKQGAKKEKSLCEIEPAGSVTPFSRRSNKRGKQEWKRE